MPTSRRAFLQTSSAVFGALGLGVPAQTLAGEPAAAKVAKSEKPLRLLVLGGTGLIGPHLVRHAIARGHQVTIFNRGKTNTHLFPEIEKLKGDRAGDLKSLEGREWDAVIDNSASLPQWVRDSAGLLEGQADLYLFTSSISAYSDHSIVGLDEDGPVGKIDPEVAAQVTEVSQINGMNYGPLKVLCEQAAREAFGEKSIVVRPGLIVGPGDYSDRFTYWPVRIDRGGEVMAPGDPTDPVQFIDVRDLAEWYVHLVEKGLTGTYNATGPGSPLSIAEMLYGIRAVTSADVSFTWVDADFLAAHEVAPWAHMTVWVPPRGGYEGFATVSCARAMAAGLSYRPLAATARDTLDWWYELPEDRRAEPKAGLPAEKEAEVLAAWHAREKEPAGKEGEGEEGEG
jgi:2'-hydroxyisoflavone reductase